MSVSAKMWTKWGFVCLAIFVGTITLVFAASHASTPEFSADEVLSEQQWRQVDSSVDRALK